MSLQYHVCHLNIGPAKAPLFDPLMEGFVSRLVEINTIASQSPGFVWQLQVDIYNPEHLAWYGEPGLLFNFSIWDSLEALHHFTYKNPDHAQMMKSRKQWFGDMDGPNYVLWWTEAGTIPSLMEAKARIAHLKQHGPSSEAFTFKDPFPPPSEEATGGEIVLIHSAPGVAAGASSVSMPQ